jgi:hypothetical protein
MVKPEIPDASIDHAIATNSHHGANDSSREAVVPVVILVNGESTGNEGCAEERCVYGNEFPEGGVVVTEEFKLGVEIKVEKDESGDWEES